ncbi:hypothetical protein K1X84_04350 [bacterium]|nr:hypothetical protein [bacterium]
MNKKVLFSALTIAATVILTISLWSSYGVAKLGPSEKLKARLKKPDISDLIRVGYNNWIYVMENNGRYMQDSPNSAPGGEFPRGSGRTIVYAGGFQFAALKKDTIRAVSEAEFRSEFQPGRITNSGLPFEQLVAEDPGSADLKVYQIDRSLSGSDYTNWPVDAPRDNNGNPALIADAQTWAVFNDLDLDLTQEREDTEDPGLGIQITLESFVYASGALNDAVYLKFTLTNKTDENYTGGYIGLWMDPDVNSDNASNDIVGVDTSRGLGFCYNGTDADRPAATGFDFLQGPVVNISDVSPLLASKFASNTSTLVYNGAQNIYVPTPLPAGKIWLGATAFNTYKSGSQPANDEQRYNQLEGKFNDGSVKTGVGVSDYYAYRGDPTAAGAGSNPNVAQAADGADQRMAHCVGPFKLDAGESQEIWAAVLGTSQESVGGNNRLTAVAQLFVLDDAIQQGFKAGLVAPAPPDIPKINVVGLDGEAVITWLNNSEYSVDKAGDILGIKIDSGFTADYITNDFQGYRVYRSLTGLPGSYAMLADYDKVDEFGTVVNITIDPSGTLITENLVVGNNTGLHYSYRDEGLTNGQVYFYSVTAYDAQPYIADTKEQVTSPFGGTVDKPSGYPISLETSPAANVVSIVPMKPLIGKTYAASLGEVEHSAGTGDGNVTVEVVDPSKITGHVYKVEFFTLHTVDGYTDGTMAYRLRDTTTNLLVPFQTRTNDPNTAADERYFDTRIAIPDNDHSDEEFNIADGMLIGVYGPAPGLNPGGEHVGWDIPTGTRQFTFAGGANAGGLEAFSGALGWDRPVHFFGNENDRYPSVDLKNILIKLASTDANGDPLDVNDVNLSYGHRYLRNAQLAPAQPAFVPFMINTTATYAYQDFVKTVPLSAWDVEDPDNPRRLAIGFLENNVTNGLVNGKYWPPFFSSGDNYAGTGPREWLFISDKTYATTSDPQLMVNALSTANMPIMYMATWARRNNTGWSASGTGSDQFRFFHVRPNAVDDVFRFTTVAAPTMTDKKSLKKELKDVRVVPNPYYARSSYQPQLFDKRLKFINLPGQCTIKIFTVSGDLVRTLVHNATSNNNRVNTNPLDSRSTPTAGETSVEVWNLQNAGNKFVASGMYIALIEAPGIGKTTVKFAVIQEEVRVNGPDIQ